MVQWCTRAPGPLGASFSSRLVGNLNAVCSSPGRSLQQIRARPEGQRIKWAEMSDELRLIREQIAQRMRKSIEIGSAPGQPSKQVQQPDPVLSVQMQAVTDAEAAAAKREQAVAMAETARAALQAALAAKESLAEQLRAEREATAAAQAVAAKAREETRDARAKEALARREVEESWQVAECIAKTFDQSIDFSALGIASPPAAQQQRQWQRQQQSLLEHSRIEEHPLAAPGIRIPVNSGRAEPTGSTSYNGRLNHYHLAESDIRFF